MNDCNSHIRRQTPCARSTTDTLRKRLATNIHKTKTPSLVNLSTSDDDTTRRPSQGRDVQHNGGPLAADWKGHGKVAVAKTLEPEGETRRDVDLRLRHKRFQFDQYPNKQRARKHNMKWEEFAQDTPVIAPDTQTLIRSNRRVGRGKLQQKQ